MLSFNDLAKKAFESIVGKGEYAGNLHFLLSPHVFYPIREKLHHFRHFEIVVCKCVQFRQVKYFVVW